MSTVPCLYAPVTVSAALPMTLRMSYSRTGPVVVAAFDTAITVGTFTAISGSGSLVSQIDTDFGTINGVSVAFSVSTNGIVTITVTGLDNGADCFIHWNNSAATGRLATALGFSTASASQVGPSGGTATFVAPYAMPGYWTPGVPPRSSEPITEQDAVVNRTQSGQNTLDVIGRWPGKRVAIEWMAAGKVKIESETVVNESLERIITSSTYPARFRWWNDRDTLASGFDDYFFEPEVLQMVDPQRLSEAVPLYSITLRMSEHVS
jgi:hypothetical protein